MKSKKFIPAAVAAFLVLFLADYLWWMVIFRSWVMTNMAPGANESILFHAVAELSLAVLMAWVYPMGFKGGSPMKEGINFGLLVGLIYQLPGAIHRYAAVGGSRRIPAFFTLNGIIVCMLAGIVIAMIYDSKKETA